MTQILLIFTGGTIGSGCTNGTIDTTDRARFKLLEIFERDYEKAGEVRFKILQPYHLLSENLHPIIWEKLIAAIEEESLDEYDGIIVTHGTDTLAFTAAALGFYFHRLDIPLLLVSSDRPPDHPEANGPANFICAVDYIVKKQAAGVWVPYQNQGQEMHLHIATRLASSLQLSGDFISVRSRPYMQYSNGRFIQMHEIGPMTAGHDKLQARFSADILLIRPYPGLNYAHIEVSGVDAILHDLYHSGTACASRDYGTHHCLPDFIEDCRNKGIKVYLAPAMQHPDLYRSTRELTERGAEIIWNMSLESAYVKLLMAYSQFGNPAEISSFLHQDTALEHVQ